MLNQLSFDLDYQKNYNKANFLVAPCNQTAMAFIENFDSLKENALLLIGPKYSGKTHLSYLFSENHLDAKNLPDMLPDVLPQKLVIEDIENMYSETNLFHWFNYAKEKKTKLLLTASYMPAIKLLDLKTRLFSIPKIEIKMPDEEVMFMVLFQLFREKNIIVANKVIEYIVHHIPRTFKAVNLFFAKLDKLSLDKKKPITIFLVKEALNNMHWEE